MQLRVSRLAYAIDLNPQEWQALQALDLASTVAPILENAGALALSVEYSERSGHTVFFCARTVGDGATVRAALATLLLPR